MKILQRTPCGSQCRISALYFIKHYTEYPLVRRQPLTSLFHFRFRAHFWTILRVGHCDKDCKFSFYSHYRKTHSCIESTFVSTLRSHTRPKLGSLLLFCQISYDIISSLNDVLIFAFSWWCWLGFRARIAQSITMRSIHYVEIFFWRGQNTTLTTTIESPLGPKQVI